MTRIQTCPPRLLAALLVLGVGVMPVDGAITYLTQERRIRAEGTVNGQFAGGRLISSTSFDLFDQSWTQVLGQNDAVLTASQRSQLLPEAILMDGLARVTLNGTFNTVETEASSLLNVTFLLDTASPFRVDHTHTSTGNAGGRLAMARLTHLPTGTVFDWNDQRTQPDTWPLSPLEGVLLPGQYNLQVTLYATRIGGIAATNECTTSFALTIPTPANAAIVGAGAAFLIARRRRRC
jgi:hypothetical protein